MLFQIHNIYQHLAKRFTLFATNHEIKKLYQAKTNHRANLDIIHACT